MKYLFILLLIALPAGLASGQQQRPLDAPRTLRPVVLVSEEGDSTYCFTRGQLRQIVKNHASWEFDKLDKAAQERIIAALQAKVVAKDAIIDALYQEIELDGQAIAGRDSIVALQQQTILIHREDIARKDEKIHSLKTQKKVGILTMLGLLLIGYLFHK